MLIIFCLIANLIDLLLWRKELMKIKMKKLLFKSIKIDDDFPLIISLNGKSKWKRNNDGQIEVENLINRMEESYTITTISEIRIKPSHCEVAIKDFLKYFLGVCDASCSPQSMWKTKDCDYTSLIVDYKINNEEQFDNICKKILNKFPRLANTENFLIKLQKNENLLNMVSQIEVAYPSTWSVDFIIVNK